MYSLVGSPEGETPLGGSTAHGTGYRLQYTIMVD